MDTYQLGVVLSLKDYLSGQVSKVTSVVDQFKKDPDKRIGYAPAHFASP